ncbi:MAG TPA: RNA polymerase sigma factor [Thermoanaerobaculia bacterium]|nr:RNA polymerase sigma factor [Thermoanaerobaculia bacterium]
MDLDSEPSRPMLVEVATSGQAPAPVFDPVRLELGHAGEDGNRLVFCKYQRRVQRFFERKGASREEAKDLTQDTFLRVFRSDVRLANGAELEAWLFEIARNVWANWLRAKATRKRAATVVSLDEPRPGRDPREVADPALVAGATDALASAITREQLEILGRALAELPEQMRQCVTMRIREDLKYGEIAAVMRISIDTVKSHLHQAKRRLRALLEPHFGPIDF